MDDNKFELFPGGSKEAKEAIRVIPEEEDYSKKMKNAPPFGPEKIFGTANPKNDYYGESPSSEEQDKKTEDLDDAALIINYGLDAVAREIGVEATIQGIKSFDVSRSDNPIRDLYIHLGINTVEELKDTHEESEANKYALERFRNEYNMPKSQQKSREGAVKAIQDMKELITEVEGADPRYQELRDAARAEGKGYFEYAVKDFGIRGLTDLFGILAEQRTKSDNKKSETTDDQSETQPAGETMPGFAPGDTKPETLKDSSAPNPNSAKQPSGDNLGNSAQLNPEILQAKTDSDTANLDSINLDSLKH